MAWAVSQIITKFYIVLAVIPLVSWTITALSLTALDVLNTNRTLIEPVASVSLLTFLICRLLVVSNPTAPARQDGTVASLIATADYGSQRGALILLVLSCAWLYELLAKGVLLLFMTIFGSVIAAAIYQDSTTHETSRYDDQQMDASTTALAKVDEFKDKAGFDPTEMFRLIPPTVLIYFVVAVWINFLSLGLYVLGHAIKSLTKVLSSQIDTIPVKVDMRDTVNHNHIASVQGATE